jgi:hypothetical protein
VGEELDLTISGDCSQSDLTIARRVKRFGYQAQEQYDLAYALQATAEPRLQPTLALSYVNDAE